MNEQRLPVFTAGFDPGPSFVDLLRRVAAARRPRGGRGGRRRARARDHPRHDRRRDPLRRRRRHGAATGAPRRATPSPTGASRRCSRPTSCSGVAIAGAAGPGGRDGDAVPGPARALREGRGRAALARGQGQPARRSWCGRNLPAAMQGFVVVPLFAGFDERRARSAACSATTPPAAGTRRADFQTNGSGGVHARNWIKAGWREGISRRRGRSTSRSGRCSPPPTRTSPPVAPTSCAGSSRRSRVIDADGFRTLADDDIAATRPTAQLGGREEGARACEHARSTSRPSR